MVGCAGASKSGPGTLSSLKMGALVVETGATGVWGTGTGSTGFLKARMRRFRLKTFLNPVVMRSIEKMLSREVGALEIVGSNAVGAEAT